VRFKGSLLLEPVHATVDRGRAVFRQKPINQFNPKLPSSRTKMQTAIQPDGKTDIDTLANSLSAQPSLT
jgi:hypothetical protein